MQFISISFIAKFFISTLLLGVILALCFVLFLPRVYSAELENGEQVVVIRAPQGGIVRALYLRLGEHVRQDTVVAEIVTTDKQPPDRTIAHAILYKRVETALYESQRGGLKALLLKPDLRARVPLDKDYGRFVAEQNRMFSAFQNRLKRETQTLKEKQVRLDIQVQGMEREISDLSQQRVLLQQVFARNRGVQLEAELLKNMNSLKHHNRQANGLRRKARKNAKALLQKTLQIRMEEGGRMEQARRDLNNFYQQIGLPPNVFDRIGLTSGDGDQRLRRLTARKAGRVVALANGLKPGDAIVAGQEIAQILPTAGRSLYRLRLRKNNVRNLEVKRLSCRDFPRNIAFHDNTNIKDDILLLPRVILKKLDFPAPRAGSRCAVIFSFAGEFTDSVVLQSLVNEMWNWNRNFAESGSLDGSLYSISALIDLTKTLLLFVKFESTNFLNELNFLRLDDNARVEIEKASDKLINYTDKATKE